MAISPSASSIARNGLAVRLALANRRRQHCGHAFERSARRRSLPGSAPPRADGAHGPAARDQRPHAEYSARSCSLFPATTRDRDASSSTLPMVTPRRLGARADTMALLRRGGTATTGPRFATIASPGPRPHQPYAPRIRDPPVHAPPPPRSCPREDRDTPRTHLARSRPCSELHLGDQFRSHPIYGVRERIACNDQRLRRVGCEFGQTSAELRKYVVRETRAHATGVVQPAPRIIITHVQRAQSLATAARRCPPQHDEFLAPATFHLHPAMSASGAVRGVHLLADDAFQSHATHLAPHGGGVADMMIAETQHAAPVAEVGQHALAVQQLAGRRSQPSRCRRSNRKRCSVASLPADNAACRRESLTHRSCRAPPVRRPPMPPPLAVPRPRAPQRAADRSSPDRRASPRAHCHDRASTAGDIRRT